MTKVTDQKYQKKKLSQRMRNVLKPMKRRAPAVPPLCRETQSLGQQMLNATVGINGLTTVQKHTGYNKHIWYSKTHGIIKHMGRYNAWVDNILILLCIIYIHNLDVILLNEIKFGS